MVTKKRFSADVIRRILAGLTSIVIFLLCWDLLVRFTELGKLMPGPIIVIIEFFKSFYDRIGQYTLFGHAYWSFSRVLIGYIIGSALGITLGFLMGRNRMVESIFRPFYEVMRSIPALAWIPIAIIWFGIGETQKYFVIFVTAFGIVTINAFSGARAVSPRLIGAARMLGARGIQIFRYITLPSSLPYIFSGLQVALSAAFATVLAAEMVRSNSGLGWIIISGMETYDVVQIVVGLFGIGILGFILATIARAGEDRLCSWRRTGG